MSPNTQTVLESRLERAIVKIDSVGGGCINQAHRVTLDDGQVVFVKTNSSARAGMFESEAVGLIALQSTNTIRIPSVIAYARSRSDSGEAGRNQYIHQDGSPTCSRQPNFGSTDADQFLVLEFIESGSIQKRGRQEFSTEFGRSLARMHRSNSILASPVASFGFEQDNFLGATPQPNPWTHSWIEFWAESRLGHQLRIASRQSSVDPSVWKLGQRLVSRLDKWLVQPDSVALLHGDLWSGNFLCDAAGRPAMMDPACYFGDREAEFGMITLFGGFDAEFYEAYNQEWSLPDGSQERIEIYRLYHLLNHLNLFGASYLSDCLTVMRKFA